MNSMLPSSATANFEHKKIQFRQMLFFSDKNQKVINYVFWSICGHFWIFFCLSLFSATYIRREGGGSEGLEKKLIQQLMVSEWFFMFYRTAILKIIFNFFLFFNMKIDQLMRINQSNAGVWTHKRLIIDYGFSSISLMPISRLLKLFFAIILNGKKSFKWKNFPSKRENFRKIFSHFKYRHFCS